MRYEGIFIDIDDTLLDYVPCCREAFDAAMLAIQDQRPMTNDERGLDWTNDQSFDLFFQISGRLFSEAKRGLHTVAEVMELYPQEFIATMGYPPEVVDPFKHAFRAAWGETHTLVPDAPETLANLQAKGYRLFAASNSFGHLQRRRLERAGILHFFEDTFISMDVGYDKPDKRFFDHALQQTGLLPDQVLMVGDSMTTDIIGAQQAGWHTCFFDRRPEEGHDHLADHEIQTLKELQELL